MACVWCLDSKSVPPVMKAPPVKPFLEKPLTETPRNLSSPQGPFSDGWSFDGQCTATVSDPMTKGDIFSMACFISSMAPGSDRKRMAPWTMARTSCWACAQDASSSPQALYTVLVGAIFCKSWTRAVDRH